MNPSPRETPMDIARLMTRIVLMPLDAAAFGAEMLAQSTKSVRKMAEQSVESLMGGMAEAAEDDYEE